MSSTLESHLLGLILADSERYFDVADTLTPTHFSEQLSASIYGAIQSVMQDGKGFSLALIESRCTVQHHEITLSAYLASLQYNAPDNIDVRDLADEIKSKWMVTKFGRVVGDLKKLHEEESNKDVASPDLVERAITHISGAFKQHIYQGIRPIGRGVEDIIAEANSPAESAGFHTGFGPMDELFAPYMPGDMTIVAGGTSMGKSSLMQVLSRHMAMYGQPCLLLTAEMTAKDTEQRIVAQDANVDTRQIAQPRTMNADEFDRVAESYERLREIPLYIDGTRRPSLDLVRLRVQRAINQFGVKAFLFDHLHFMALPRASSRYEAMTELTASLHEMCGDLNVHGFVGSQLSRKYSEQEAAKTSDIRRPRESDLRDSGSIEQDADNIVFIHRPERILERNRPSMDAEKAYNDWLSSMDTWRGKAELIRTKRRQGPGHLILKVDFISHSTNITERRTDEGGMF